MATIEAYNDIPTDGYDPKKISVPDGIAFAAKASGRGAIEIGREYWRLSKGPGKISMSEYCTFRLFDSEKYTPEDKARFVSESLHWPIVSDCNDLSWFAAVEDKWLAETILAKGGLKTPENLAVIDTGPRAYPPDKNWPHRRR